MTRLMPRNGVPWSPKIWRWLRIKNIRRHGGAVPIYGLLVVLALICVVPLLWAVSASLHSNATVYSAPFSWVPRPPLVQNYVRGWAASSFGRAMVNSFFIALVVTFVSVVCGLMGGYGLAKFKFRGRQAIFASVIVVLLVPFTAIMVPVFAMTRTMGLVDTYAGVIIPGVISPLGVFLMRQYLQALPDELLYAARIDGAREWTILWRIVLPLSWPVVGAVGVLTFVASWNNLLWPLIVIDSERLYTIPLALEHFNSVNFTNYVQMVAMSVVAIVPIVALFAIARKRLLDSIMLSGGGLVG